MSLYRSDSFLLLYEGKEQKGEKRLFTASPVVSQLVHQQLHLHVLQQFHLLVEQFDLFDVGREALVLVNSIVAVIRLIRITSSELNTLNHELCTTTENLQLSSIDSATHTLTNSTLASINVKVCKFRQTVDELSNSHVRQEIDIISSGQNILAIFSTTIRRKRICKVETVANTVNTFVHTNADQFGLHDSNSGSNRIFGLSCHNNVTCSFSTGIRINDGRIASTNSRCITNDAKFFIVII